MNYAQLKVLEALFWPRIAIRGQKKCWLWQGTPNRDGYGCLQRRLDGRHRHLLTHRLAFLFRTQRNLATTVVLRHSCDVRLCCNPAHLLPGTHNDNVQDRVARGRSATGERNGRAKLTAADIPLIRARLRAGETVTILGRLYGVDHGVIAAIRDKRAWVGA